MSILSKSTLKDFWLKYPDSIQALKAWYRDVDSHQWKSINELKMRYPNISILHGNRIVFNIKGNHYRLVTKFNFDYKMVWIRFIGTHAEYDKIDANTI